MVSEFWARKHFGGSVGMEIMGDAVDQSCAKMNSNDYLGAFSGSVGTT